MLNKHLKTIDFTRTNLFLVFLFCICFSSLSSADLTPQFNQVTYSPETMRLKVGQPFRINFRYVRPESVSSKIECLHNGAIVDTLVVRSTHDRVKCASRVSGAGTQEILIRYSDASAELTRSFEVLAEQDKFVAFSNVSVDPAFPSPNEEVTITYTVTSNAGSQVSYFLNNENIGWQFTGIAREGAQIQKKVVTWGGLNQFTIRENYGYGDSNTFEFTADENATENPQPEINISQINLPETVVIEQSTELTYRATANADIDVDILLNGVVMGSQSLKAGHLDYSFTFLPVMSGENTLTFLSQEERVITKHVFDVAETPVSVSAYFTFSSLPAEFKARQAYTIEYMAHASDIAEIDILLNNKVIAAQQLNKGLTAYSVTLSSDLVGRNLLTFNDKSSNVLTKLYFNVLQSDIAQPDITVRDIQLPDEVFAGESSTIKWISEANMEADIDIYLNNTLLETQTTNEGSYRYSASIPALKIGNHRISFSNPQIGQLATTNFEVIAPPVEPELTFFDAKLSPEVIQQGESALLNFGVNSNFDSAVELLLNGEITKTIDIFSGETRVEESITVNVAGEYQLSVRELTSGESFELPLTVNSQPPIVSFFEIQPSKERFEVSQSNHISFKFTIEQAPADIEFYLNGELHHTLDSFRGTRSEIVPIYSEDPTEFHVEMRIPDINFVREFSGLVTEYIAISRINDGWFAGSDEHQIRFMKTDPVIPQPGEAFTIHWLSSANVADEVIFESTVGDYTSVNIPAGTSCQSISLPGYEAGTHKLSVSFSDVKEDFVFDVFHQEKVEGAGPISFITRDNINLSSSEAVLLNGRSTSHFYWKACDPDGIARVDLVTDEYVIKTVKDRINHPITVTPFYDFTPDRTYYLRAVDNLGNASFSAPANFYLIFSDPNKALREAQFDEDFYRHLQEVAKNSSRDPSLFENRQFELEVDDEILIYDFHSGLLHDFERQRKIQEKPYLQVRMYAQNKLIHDIEYYQQINDETYAVWERDFENGGFKPETDDEDWIKDRTYWFDESLIRKHQDWWDNDYEKSRINYNRNMEIREARFWRHPLHRHELDVYDLTSCGKNYGKTERKYDYQVRLEFDLNHGVENFYFYDDYGHYILRGRYDWEDNEWRSFRVYDCRGEELEEGEFEAPSSSSRPETLQDVMDMAKPFLKNRTFSAEAFYDFYYPEGVAQDTGELPDLTPDKPKLMGFDVRRQVFTDRAPDYTYGFKTNFRTGLTQYLDKNGEVIFWFFNEDDIAEQYRDLQNSAGRSEAFNTALQVGEVNRSVMPEIQLVMQSNGELTGNAASGFTDGTTLWALITIDDYQNFPEDLYTASKDTIVKLGTIAGRGLSVIVLRMDEETQLRVWGETYTSYVSDEAKATWNSAREMAELAESVYQSSMAFYIENEGQIVAELERLTGKRAEYWSSFSLAFLVGMKSESAALAVTSRKASLIKKYLQIKMDTLANLYQLPDRYAEVNRFYLTKGMNLDSIKPFEKMLNRGWDIQKASLFFSFYEKVLDDLLFKKSVTDRNPETISAYEDYLASMFVNMDRYMDDFEKNPYLMVMPSIIGVPDLEKIPHMKGQLKRRKNGNYELFDESGLNPVPIVKDPKRAGTYVVNYVFMDGKLYFGYKHVFISGSRSVRYAGSLIFNEEKNKIIEVDNNTGHYQVDSFGEDKEGQDAVIQALKDVFGEDIKEIETRFQ